MCYNKYVRQRKEVIKMKEKILTKVIRKYGFEHSITIWTAKIIEKICQYDEDEKKHYKELLKKFFYS